MSGPTIVIIGAGAGGICLGIQLLRAGYTRFRILERSAGVGGTWRDNRYPGAGCDVPSHLYCFSFEPNPNWSRKFAPQAEIEAYLQGCVDKYGLAPHIQLQTEVTETRFDEQTSRWRVATSDGEVIEAQVLVAATGQLSRPFVPELPGAGDFDGLQFHSARWPEPCELEGRLVGVVGSAASAVQIVPAVAPRVQRLTLFQRSANHVLPRRDRVWRSWEKAAFRRVPGLLWAYRAWIYAALEARWPAFLRRTPIGGVVARQIQRELDARVADETLRGQLTPEHRVGCRRILISDDWFDALQRDNVEVQCNPIERLEPSGVRTADGRLHRIDVLVYATGFEATGFLQPIRVVGRDDCELAEVWRDGARAYLGMCVPGFPNFFMLYGPNTNLGHSSILFMIECQVRYFVDWLRCLSAGDAVEVRRPAMEASQARLEEDLDKTVWAEDCSSWYKTAGGVITNNWSGSTTAYWWRTRKVRSEDFVYSSSG